MTATERPPKWRPTAEQIEAEIDADIFRRIVVNSGSMIVLARRRRPGARLAILLCRHREGVVSEVCSVTTIAEGGRELVEGLAAALEKSQGRARA